MLQTFDAFSKPIPAFNIKGKDRVNTRIGGLITILISFTVLMYAAIKFSHLSTKKNPQMSQYYQDVPKDVREDVRDQGFRIAVSIEDYISPKKFKNDPKYVKWLLRIFGKKDGE